MKKLLSGFLASVVALTTITGCGAKQTSSKNADTSKGQVTINILSSDDFASFRKKVIPEFEKANPGIKVNFSSVGYDALHQKEVTALAGGSDSYDIIDVDCIWTPEYVTNGYIEKIDDRMTDEMKKGIAPVALDILKYKDSYYGLPMFNDLFFMYYNKDILKKAGMKEFPKTWDDFTKLCESIKKQGLADYGSAWGWAQAEGLVCYYMMFMKAYGGDLIDSNFKPTVNTPENITALQYMTDSLYKSKISDPASVTADDRNAISLFSQGKLPFVFDWSFAWSTFNDPSQSKVAGKVGIALAPGSAKVASASCAGSMGLAITSKSKNKDAAWKLIEFLASKDIQKRQAQDSGALPIWSDLYKDADLVKSNPSLPDMLKQVEYAYNRPSLTWYNEFSSTLQVELQNALTKKKTPKQALDDAQKSLTDMAAQNQ